MINAAEGILNGFFDIMLVPFRALPHFWGLLFISLLTGLGMIAVFGLVSNQKKIKKLRQRMGGEVLGILLHVSRPGTVVKFAVKLIWSNTIYLGYLLKPLVVIAIPFILVWGQLDARYGSDYRMDMDYPLTMTVHYENGLPERDSIDIQTDAMQLIPPVVMVDTLDEASFRLLPSGDSLRSITIGGTIIRIGRTGNWNGCLILRGFDSGSSLWKLFTPWIGSIDSSEDAPDSGFYSMHDVRYSVLGGYWSWIAVFLVFSSISAIAGAKLFKIKV